MRTLCVHALVLSLVVATTAHADDRTSMDRYVAEVAAQNPSLRAGALRRDSFGEEAIATGKWPDPFVSVMVDQVPQATGGQMPMVRYQVTQMLPWPGKLGFMREAVEKRGEGAGADLDVRRLDLRLAAERAYVMLWMNAKRRELNRSQRALASTIASAALGRYGAGLGDHHDVARAEVEVNALDVEQINLEGERGSIVAMMNALRNEPSDRPIADPIDLATPSPPPTLGSLSDLALARRPELRRMTAMQNEEGAMAALARREPYPDLMTSLWANQMIGGPPTMGGMVGFALPVFGASRASHLGAAFDARAGGAAQDAEAMRAMIRGEVADALVKLQTASRQVEIVETVASPKAHESFDASLAAYGTGRVDILSVLDSRRALQTAEAMLIEARAQRALAAADLERATGGSS